METRDGDGGHAAAIVRLHAGDDAAVGIVFEVVHGAVDGGGVEPGVDGDVSRRGEGEVGLTHSTHGGAVDNPTPELIVGVGDGGGQGQRSTRRPLADVVDRSDSTHGVVGVLHDGNVQVALLVEDGLHGGVGGHNPLQVVAGALHGTSRRGDDPLLEGPVARAFGVEGDGAVLKHVLVEARADRQVRGHDAGAFLLNSHIEVLGYTLQHGGEVHIVGDGVDMVGVVDAHIGACVGVNPFLEGVSVGVVHLNVEARALDMLAGTCEGNARDLAGGVDEGDIVDGLVHSLDGHVGIEGAFKRVGDIGGILDAVDAPVRELKARTVVGGHAVEGTVLVAAVVHRGVGVAEGSVGEGDGVGGHEVGHDVGIGATYIINSIRVGAAAQARAAPAGEEIAGVGSGGEADAAAILHGGGGRAHGAGAGGVDIGGDGPGLVAELCRQRAVAHHGVYGVGQLGSEAIVALVVPAKEYITRCRRGAEGERGVHAGARRGVGHQRGGTCCGAGDSRHSVGALGVLKVSGVGSIA